MGMTATAILYFGYDLGDLTDPETYEFVGPSWMGANGDHWGSDDELARRLGWFESPFPSHLYNITAHSPEWREFKETPAHQEWHESMNDKRRLINDFGVEVDRYGHIDGDLFFRVVVKASVIDVDWGESKLIDFSQFQIDVNWLTKLNEFMDLLEIPIPDGQVPAWHLTVSYG